MIFPPLLTLFEAELWHIPSAGAVLGSMWSRLGVGWPSGWSDYKWWCMFFFVLHVGSSYLADSCLHLFKWFIIKNTPLLFCSHNRTYSRLCFDHLGEVCVDISMQAEWVASVWMTHSCCQDWASLTCHRGHPLQLLSMVCSTFFLSPLKKLQ